MRYFLILLLLVGMAAAQNAATTPQNAPSTPTQDEPSQSTPPAQNHQPAVAQRSIDDELGLSPDQKQKIAAVIDDENKQIAAVRDDSTLNADQKQQKMLQVRQVGAPKIKAILTPEQLQKLAAIQERNRQEQNTQQAAPPKR